MLNINFVTVNFNGSKHTIKYIDSVKKLLRSDNCVSIMIIDNNSDLDDFLILRESVKRLENVNLIRNKSNIGYFAGLNVGIANAPYKKKSLFVIGNNDLKFNPDFILELNNLQYDDSTMVIAPNIITLDGYHQNPHYIIRMSTLRKLGFRIYFSNYYLGLIVRWLIQKLKILMPLSPNDEFKKRQFIHMGVGACYILTGHFFKSYSKLNAKVFLWGEEALLADQLLSAGSRMLYEPKLVVHHAESGSVKKVPSKEAYKIGKESFRIYSTYL